MTEKIQCPKCGYIEQSTPSGKCYKCGYNVKEYLLKKRGETTTEKELEEKPVGLSATVWNIIERISTTAFTEQRLSSFGALFGRTWKTYKKRYIVLSILFFVSVILLSVEHTFYWIIAMSFYGKTIEPAARLLAIAGIITFLVLAFWSQAAFVFAASNEGQGIKGAIMRGFERIGSYILLFIILSVISIFVIMTIIIFFMVLGVIVRSILFFLPQIIVSLMFVLSVFLVLCIWFVFAFFVCVVFAAEDESATGALSRSVGYFKGLWFDMIRRVLFMPAIIFIANIPVIYLIYKATMSFDYPKLIYKLVLAANVAVVFINSILVPFFAIFVCKLYEETKVLKEK